MSAESEQSGPRPSFLDISLTVDERDQLTALRAATSEQAPLYIAILTALATAKSAYHLQLRTSEIRSHLVDGTAESGTFRNETDQSLRPALDQLRAWRCVDWVQDPSFRATSVEEYLKRHELWELTAVGDATLSAVSAVLAADEESGSLQRAMFRQIQSALDRLSSAIAHDEATDVYLQLRDLDLAITELARNAREFYATISRIAREERLADHVFLMYKDQLIAYLHDFHDDLVRNRSIVSRLILGIDTASRTQLLELAAAGDDSTGLFNDSTGWERRWDGMLDWFVAGRLERSEADALGDATTVAIRELLTLLRRLTEQTTRPVNRASELRETAAWFARCETDDDAHRLFDAAFGLTATAHVGLENPDPEAEGNFPSWWTTAPVDVPISLREYGRRPAPGRTGRRHDYTDAKRLLEHQAEIDRLAQATASGELVDIDLRTARIAESSWPILLNWLDQALADRPAGTTFAATVRAPDALIHLRSADHDTRLLAPAGTVILENCELRVTGLGTTDQHGDDTRPGAEEMAT